MKIIFATQNKGKVKEVMEILSNDIELITMSEAGIDIDVVEDGDTFAENARKKAVEIAKISKMPVIADDSGLEIDYFDKKPGVYSARFMGHDTPYSIKNKKILDLMKDVDESKRSARFVCDVCYVSPSGEIFEKEGVIEGIIGYEIKGENGFGYDPIFYIPSLGKYLAQLSLDEKNSISHRGKAMRAIKEVIVENMNK